MTASRSPVPTRLIAGLLILGLFLLGFAVGRSGRTDPGRADGVRKHAFDATFKVARAAALTEGRASGKKAGATAGRKAGHVAGKHAARRRVKRDLADGTATSPSTTTTSPYTDQNGTPAPNPNCPSGQEPTPGGGCAPYNDQNGQLEPKINDPRCYKPDPPAGCF